MYEKYLAGLQRGGRFRVAEVLQVWVRYFTDSWVLGSQAYLEEPPGEFRDCFDAKCKVEILGWFGVVGLASI